MNRPLPAHSGELLKQLWPDATLRRFAAHNAQRRCCCAECEDLRGETHRARKAVP
jgi:hypothetical protein